MNRILLFAASAVVALVMPLSAGAATPDPCKVVSPADAAKALGSPVTGTTPRAIGGSMSCGYHTSALPRLSVTIVPSASPAAAKSEFHSMVTSSMTYVAPSQDLSGIGDEAHRLGPSIYVRKGSNIYVFTMISKDDNGAGATRTIALAKSSITRIP
jgi:hypothetical protein